VEEPSHKIDTITKCLVVLGSVVGGNIMEECPTRDPPHRFVIVEGIKQDVVIGRR
jgi:hypothetical protein